MVAMYSMLLLLPLFLQNVRGLGAMETGMILFPNAIAATVMMPISGKLLDKIGARPLAIPGLLALAFGTWLVAGLDPGTSDETLRWSLILRGVATGLMFMPVMTVAMDNIAPAQIPRATALSNVLRQLAGAFGTAMFASLLLSREHFHTAVLTQAVTPNSLAAVHLLSATKLALMAQGFTEAAAQTIGLMGLARQVAVAATVRAFDDCFVVATWVALAAVLPALWLKRRRKVGGSHQEAIVEMG
jgi:MFS family permease